jgi:hypothetical protein
MSIPSIIAAGDTVTWTESLGCYESGAVLSYALRGPGAPVNLAVGSDGSASLDAVTSTGMNSTPATVIWYWQRYVAVGADRRLDGEGQLQVKANLAALTGAFDGRSQTQKNLDAVRAAITARANGGLVQSYSIGQRNLAREPVKELLALESRLVAQLRREQAAQAIANGKGNPGKTFVRFGNHRGGRC